MTTLADQKPVDAAEDKLFKIVGFDPWPEQADVLDRYFRYIMVAGGEQGGKSLMASKWVVRRLPEDLALAKEEGPDVAVLYWLVAADYARTKREFFYLVDDLRAIFGKQAVKASKRLDPGSIEVYAQDGRERRLVLRVETKSAKDATTLAMDAPHGIVVCEASQVDLQTFERVMGRTAPRRGWAFFSGTFEASIGWYPTTWEQWQAVGLTDRQSYSVPSWANLSYYPEGRNDPEILRLERDSSDDFFMERIAGKPVPPKGLVFHEFRADIHVQDVQWLGPDETVYLWEDPGYGSDSAHAIEVAHIVGGQVRVFDEIYERGLITEQIIEICQAKPWWKSPKVLVTDPHYKDAHHSMTSVAEEWMQRTGLHAGGTRTRINAGSERLKGFLKPDPLTMTPKIVFSPVCHGILSEFGMEVNPFDRQVHPYRWAMDSSGVVIGEVPKDKWNHGVKAVIYGLVDKFGYNYVTQKSEIPVRRGGYGPRSLARRR